MDEILVRVQRLEEELRKVKRSRTIWLLLSAGMLLVAFQSPPSDTNKGKVVEAQEFRLVDEAGRLRGSWSTGRTDPFTRFSMWDWAGIACDEVVRIQSREGGGEITLMGDTDHGRVDLSTEDGGGHLRLRTVRTTKQGGIGYHTSATVDALPDNGRIELFQNRFEDTAEGGLTVSSECVFHAPERK